MISYVVRFSIAVAIAVVAVVLNFAWVKQNTNTTEYVIVNQQIDKDEIIRSSDLTSISLPQKYRDQYDKTFVPYEDRFWVIGKPASKVFEKNEIILRQYLEDELDNLPKIDVLGPFRLYSVGTQLVGTASTQSTYAYGGGIPITFIAKRVQGKDNELTFDKNTRRLLQLIEYEKTISQQRGQDKGWRILSITNLPDEPNTDETNDDETENSNTTETPYQLAADEVTITVEVPNVPILSTVLMNSKNPRIGFLVPSDVLKAHVMKNLE
jgi:hypothetical protein